MALLKLKAPVKDYIWGGQRLIEEYNKKAPGGMIAESWELSCYPGCSSVISGGEYDKMSLPDYIDHMGKQVLGKKCEGLDFFPILVKLIDAKNDLSIQVHPGDEYALEHEHQYGKTEMWYVLEADEGAFLYYGFNRKVSREEFAQRIEDGSLTDVLNAVPVKNGDVFFIEAGTIHAIGKGIVLAEIQQNSDVTYRVYDYKRKDAQGRERELHIDKALEVTKLEPVREIKRPEPHIGQCKYFTVDRERSGDKEGSFKGSVGDGSFKHFLFTRGKGNIICGKEEMGFIKGDSFFITADSGDYEIKGQYEVIISYVG